MTQPSGLREDLKRIAELIPAGSRVLDVGCADGALLAYLEAEKGCDARGIELSRGGVNASLAKGLSVVQGDADRDLQNYPDDGFDIAVLSQTVQAMRAPREVLGHLLRIAPQAVVSFPNFGHWKVRLALGLRGRMPVTSTLPVSWYETANIHFCTIRDFVDLAHDMGLHVAALQAAGQRVNPARLAMANITAPDALVLLNRGSDGKVSL